MTLADDSRSQAAPGAILQPKRFAAFISHRNAGDDRRIAVATMESFERFRVPRALVRSGAPRRVGRVFLAIAELGATPELSGALKQALQDSEFLVVVCTPDSQSAEWVQAEVDYFVSLGRLDRIQLLWVAGEPESAFPTAVLRRMRARFERPSLNLDDAAPDYVAADIRAKNAADSIRLLRTEKLRLIAPIIGCRFDELRRRDEERRRTTTISISSLSIALAAIFAGLAIWLNIALRAARHNEALADRRLTSAVALANEVQNTVDTQLSTLPGSTAIRRYLLAKTRELLDELTASKPGDARIEETELGLQDHELNVDVLSTGASALSIVELERMLAACRARRSAEPAEPKWQLAEANCLFHLGTAQGVRGDTRAATASFDAAAELLELWTPGKADDDPGWRTVALIEVRQGETELENRKLEAAGGYFDRAERIANALVAADSEAPLYAQLAFLSAHAHARLAEAAGDRAGSRKWRTRSFEACRRYRVLDYPSPESAMLLADACAELARVLDLEPDRERIEELLLEARHESRDLFRRDPHAPRARASYADALLSLGRFLHRTGRVGAAADVYREANGAFESVDIQALTTDDLARAAKPSVLLARVEKKTARRLELVRAATEYAAAIERRDERNVDALEVAADVFLSYGTELETAGQVGLASDALERAERLVERALAIAPGSAMDTLALGRVQLRRASVDGDERALDAAYAVLDGCFGREELNHAARVLLSRTFAEAQRRRALNASSGEAAMNLAKESLALLQSEWEHGTRDSDLAQRLAMTLVEVGGLQLGVGDRESAAGSFNRAIDVVDAGGVGEPSHELETVRANALLGLTNVHFVRDDTAKASQCADAAVTTLESCLAADHQLASARSALVDALRWRSRILRGSDQCGRAVDTCDRAVAVAEESLRPSPDNASFMLDVIEARNELGRSLECSTQVERAAAVYDRVVHSIELTIRFAKSGSALVEKLSAQTGLLRIAVSKGDPTEIERCVADALKAAEDLEGEVHESQTLSTRTELVHASSAAASVLAAAGKLDSALAAARVAAASAERLRCSLRENAYVLTWLIESRSAALVLCDATGDADGARSELAELDALRAEPEVQRFLASSREMDRVIATIEAARRKLQRPSGGH